MKYILAFIITAIVILLYGNMDRTHQAEPVRRIAPAEDDEIKVVALTLFGEARSQTIRGKRAVASVIYNRANGNAKLFKKVCLEKRQFSCWNQNDPNSRILHNVNVRKMSNSDRKSYGECIVVAQSMFAGKFQPSVSSQHYATKQVNPYWARRMMVEVVIGNHVFYRRV